jgi:hypothetical protein
MLAHLDASSWGPVQERLMALDERAKKEKSEDEVQRLALAKARVVETQKRLDELKEELEAIKNLPAGAERDKRNAAAEKKMEELRQYANETQKLLDRVK